MLPRAPPDQPPPHHTTAAATKGLPRHRHAIRLATTAPAPIMKQSAPMPPLQNQGSTHSGTMPPKASNTTSTNVLRIHTPPVMATPAEDGFVPFTPAAMARPPVRDNILQWHDQRSFAKTAATIATTTTTTRPLPATTTTTHSFSSSRLARSGKAQLGITPITRPLSARSTNPPMFPANVMPTKTAAATTTTQDHEATNEQMLAHPPAAVVTLAQRCSDGSTRRDVILSSPASFARRNKDQEDKERERSQHARAQQMSAWYKDWIGNHVSALEAQQDLLEPGPSASSFFSGTDLMKSLRAVLSCKGEGRPSFAAANAHNIHWMRRHFVLQQVEAHYNELKALRVRAKAASHQIRELSQSRAHALFDLKRTQDDVEARDAALALAKRAHAHEVRKLKAELSKTVIALEKTQADLSRVSDMRSTENGDATRQLNTLRDKLEETKKLHAESEKQRYKIHKEHGRCQYLNSENEKLRRALQTEKSIKDGAAARLSQRDTQIAQLTITLDEEKAKWSQDNSKLSEKVELGEKRIEDLQHSKGEVQAMLADVQQRFQKSQGQVDRHRRAYENTVSQMSTMQKEIEVLQENLYKTRREFDKHKKDAEGSIRLERAKAEESLLTVSDDLTRLKSDHDQTREELAALQQKYTDFRVKHANCSHSAREKQERSTSALRDALSDANKTISRIETPNKVVSRKGVALRSGGRGVRSTHGGDEAENVSLSGTHGRGSSGALPGGGGMGGPSMEAMTSSLSVMRQALLNSKAEVLQLRKELQRKGAGSSTSGMSWAHAPAAGGGSAASFHAGDNRQHPQPPLRLAHTMAVSGGVGEGGGHYKREGSHSKERSGGGVATEDGDANSKRHLRSRSDVDQFMTNDLSDLQSMSAFQQLRRFDRGGRAGGSARSSVLSQRARKGTAGQCARVGSRGDVIEEQRDAEDSATKKKRRPFHRRKSSISQDDTSIARSTPDVLAVKVSARRKAMQTVRDDLAMESFGEQQRQSQDDEKRDDESAAPKRMAIEVQLRKLAKEMSERGVTANDWDSGVATPLSRRASGASSYRGDGSRLSAAARSFLESYERDTAPLGVVAEAFAAQSSAATEMPKSLQQTLFHRDGGSAAAAARPSSVSVSKDAIEAYGASDRDDERRRFGDGKRSSKAGVKGVLVHSGGEYGDDGKGLHADPSGGRRTITTAARATGKVTGERGALNTEDSTPEAVVSKEKEVDRVSNQEQHAKEPTVVELTKEQKAALKRQRLVERLRAEHERYRLAGRAARQQLKRLKPLLGVVFVTGHPEGMLITEVRRGEPGARCGIHANDIMTHVNRKPTLTKNDFFGALKQSLPGDTLELTVRRGRVTKKLKLLVGAKGVTDDKVTQLRELASFPNVPFDPASVDGVSQ